MKHTKGKWFPRKCTDGEIDIASHLSETMESPSIAIVQPVSSMLAKVGGGTTEANARLIASAPDMLEVLKNAEGVVRLTSPSMADTIKEQIAKAEGDTQNCEHKNKPIYQPEEKDTGIPESYTCDDCGKEFDIPEPDFDLMNKE